MVEKARFSPLICFLLLCDAKGKQPSSGFAVDYEKGTFSVEVVIDDSQIDWLTIGAFEEPAHVANTFFRRKLGVADFTDDVLEAYSSLVLALREVESRARTATNRSVAAFW